MVTPKGGRSHKICRNCINRHRREKNSSLENKVANLVSVHRYQCKKKDLPFDLDKKWLLEKIKNTTKCECCGKPIYININGNSDKKWQLDKVEPSKGYIKSNIAIICRRCNRIKSSATINDILMITKYVLQFRGVIGDSAEPGTR